MEGMRLHIIFSVVEDSVEKWESYSQSSYCKSYNIIVTGNTRSSKIRREKINDARKNQTRR